MAPDPSDHELLLQLGWEFSQIRVQLQEALVQLSKGNARFEQIALKEQEMMIGLTSLRSDFSRAILSADSASSLARQALELGKSILKDFEEHLTDVRTRVERTSRLEERLSNLERELERWKNYLKVVAIIWAPIQVIIIAVVIDIVKRGITPPTP